MWLALLGLMLGTAGQAQPKLPRPAITGIAHLVVLNDDLAASRHFCGDLIGWPASPPMGEGTALHFQVGLKQYIEVKVAPAKNPPDRVSLIAFETADLSALRAYLAANGIAVPTAVKVHANGARSIEVRDPDGNPVEFTSGGTFPPPATAPRALSTHLIHIGFDVHNIPAQTHFWQEVLGFRLYWHGWQKDEGAIRIPHRGAGAETIIVPGFEPTQFVMSNVVLSSRMGR